MRTLKKAARYLGSFILLVSIVVLFKLSTVAAVDHPESCFTWCIIALIIFFSGQDIITFIENKMLRIQHNRSGKSIALAAVTRALLFAVAYLCATQAEYAANMLIHVLLDLIAFICFWFGRFLADDIREQRRIRIYL
jgi:ACR3 family arsenite efflux pump ArsB